MTVLEPEDIVDPEAGPPIRDPNSWHVRFGGRKLLVTLVGIFVVLTLAIIGASPEAYIAVSTMVLAFSGANAVVEWKHAGVMQESVKADAVVAVAEAQTEAKVAQAQATGAGG